MDKIRVWDRNRKEFVADFLVDNRGDVFIEEKKEWTGGPVKHPELELVLPSRCCFAPVDISFSGRGNEIRLCSECGNNIN